MRIRDFIDAYEQRSGYRSKKNGDGSYQVHCLSHEDSKASVTVTESGKTNSQGNTVDLVLKCHAGCLPASVLGAVGMKLEDLYENKEQEKKTWNIEAVYPYYDADGTYLFEVVRYEGKRMFPRRKAEDGAWIWGLKEQLYKKENGAWKRVGEKENTEGLETKVFPTVKRVPYNLLEVLKRKEEPVIIVGGEKDVDNLKKYGLLGTTNPLGEGKWNPAFNIYLKGRRVVIIPDNDRTGYESAKSIKNSLAGTASSVQIIELEGLEAKGDFSDWIKDHEIEELWDKIYGITLPNARTAEVEILKAVFKDNAIINDLIEDNTLEFFFFRSNREILKAMMICQEDRIDINKVTVAERLGNNLISCGGYQYLEELSGQ